MVHQLPVFFSASFVVLFVEPQNRIIPQLTPSFMVLTIFHQLVHRRDTSAAVWFLGPCETRLPFALSYFVFQPHRNSGDMPSLPSLVASCLEQKRVADYLGLDSG